VVRPAAVVLILLALLAVSMGALMISDGFVGRGLLTMAAGMGPAVGARRVVIRMSSRTHAT
jgi:hypothetical protein